LPCVPNVVSLSSSLPCVPNVVSFSGLSIWYYLAFISIRHFPMIGKTEFCWRRSLYQSIVNGIWYMFYGVDQTTAYGD
jgi:hypothetical protein